MLQAVYRVCDGVKAGCGGQTSGSAPLWKIYAEGSRETRNTDPSLQRYAEMKRKLASLALV